MSSNKYYNKKILSVEKVCKILIVSFSDRDLKEFIKYTIHDNKKRDWVRYSSAIAPPWSEQVYVFSINQKCDIKNVQIIVTLNNQKEYSLIIEKLEALRFWKMALRLGRMHSRIFQWSGYRWLRWFRLKFGKYLIKFIFFSKCLFLSQFSFPFFFIEPKIRNPSNLNLKFFF
jgi:hypothetical protein